MTDPSTQPLTESSAYEVLADVCRRAGIEAAGAELIRLGSNAVFRLPKRVIVRIARDGETLDSAQRQVDVARWLEREGYPATRALELPQPMTAAGHVTTFWVSAAEDETYAPVDQVGDLIRRLHRLETPTVPALPDKKPFEELAGRMSALPYLDPADAEFIRTKVDELADAYESLDFALPIGPVHGDANVGNVILDRDRNPLLIDLDNFAIGPREWDLVQTALFYERFGWHTDDEYRAFVDAYGFDVMEWDGYSTLADYREITMTLWLAGKAASEPRAADEVHKRVETLRSGGDRREWKPF